MINKRAFIVTNIKNSPIRPDLNGKRSAYPFWIRSILIFLSVITFVVFLLALIGVIGIFVSVITGSLGILFMVRNRIRKFLGKKQEPTLKENTDSNLIELERDDFKICE